MPKWISIGKAAIKYGMAKEVFRHWIETGRITVPWRAEPFTIEEETLENFMRQHKEQLKAEYVDTLEELCIAKTRICELYSDIIDTQSKELLLQREKIAKIKEIQEEMKRQNDRMRDCEKMIAQYEMEKVANNSVWG